MELSVRAFAELVTLPAYGHERLLYDQKYPTKAPGLFKVAYYAPTMTAIRRYYAAGNAAIEISGAVMALQQSGTNQTKVANNVRALTAFKNSREATRTLVPVAAPKLKYVLGPATIRVAPDLMVAPHGAHQAGTAIFYHLGVAPRDDEITRYILEFAHAALVAGGYSLAPKDVEFVDVTAGVRVVGRPMRKSTVKNARACAKIAQMVWTSI